MSSPQVDRAREQGARRGWTALTVFLGLSALVAWQGLLPGRILAPVDITASMPPFCQEEPANFLLADQATQFVPWTSWAVERLRTGEMPLWNPHGQLGVPFIGNGQSGVFRPSMLLHLLLPATWSWTLAAILRLTLAGMGAWALARHYAASATSALLSGVVFLACGFMVAWLNHPHAEVAAWLPWGVLAAERLCDHVSRARVCALSLVFGLSMLGGHPGTILHLLLVVGLLVLLRLFSDARSRRWLVLAGFTASVGLAILLAGIQLIPLVEYIGESGARESRLAAGVVFRPWVLLGVFFPYLNGYPADGVTSSWFYEATGIPNTSEIACGWAGSVVVVLTVLAVARDRRNPIVGRWALVGLVAALIGAYVPGVAHLIKALPGIGQVQNGRLVVAIALALAILGGRGFDLALQSDVARRTCAKAALFIGSLCTLGCLLMVTSLCMFRQQIVDRGLTEVQGRFAQDSDGDGHDFSLDYYQAQVSRIHRELVLTSWRAMLPAATLLLLALALRRKGCARLVPVVAALELLAFAMPYNPGVPSASLFPGHPSLDELKRLQTETGARFTGTRDVLPPELAMVYGLDDVRGYDAVVPRRYLAWISALDAATRRTRFHVDRLWEPGLPVMAILGLRYLLQPIQEPVRLPWTVRVQDVGGMSILERGDALPRVWLPQRVTGARNFEDVLARLAAGGVDARSTLLLEDSSEERWLTGRGLVVSMERISPESVRIVLDDAAGQWVVHSETYFPGWQAVACREGAADGTSLAIQPAYGVLQGMRIPDDLDGRIEILLTYAPSSWTAGRLSTLVGALALGALALRSGGSNRRRWSAG